MRQWARSRTAFRLRSDAARSGDVSFKSEIRIAEIRKKPEGRIPKLARAVCSFDFRISDFGIRIYGPWALSSLPTRNHKPKTHNKQNHMTTSSPERIATNRANAQKSTGPKTAEGKAASKRNAVKHGLLSREVLVAGEDHQALTALQQWFAEELQPVGPMEVMLVGQIVATHWRLRRVLAAESGDIKREAQLKAASAPSSALPPALEDTVAGCQLLQTWLSDTLLAVERDGELTLGTVGEFSTRVGDRPSLLKCNLIKLHFRHRPDKKQDTEEEEPWLEAHKKEVITFLNEHLSRLATRETHCQKLEEKEAKARQTYAVLPSAEAMERLGRYESMLNRQLFRAMKELRTLQKEREGRNPKAEVRGENLPNEPIPERERERGGRGEREVLRNEATDEVGKEEPRMEHGLNTDKKLPNEAIALGAPVQGSEFKVQSSEELQNEPILAAQPTEI